MGGKRFWSLNLAIALLCTVIPVVYCLIVIPDLDVSRLAWPGISGAAAPYFRGGLKHFMEVLPLASWFYVGCEALPLASEEVHQVRWDGVTHRVVPPQACTAA